MMAFMNLECELANLRWEKEQLLKTLALTQDSLKRALNIGIRLAERVAELEEKNKDYDYAKGC